jgi:hypothetical protein
MFFVNYVKERWLKVIDDLDIKAEICPLFESKKGHSASGA